LCQPKIPFSKPALSVEDQLSLLQERGLIVENFENAKRELGFLGYYRLSGYYRYFADYSDPELKRFRSGTSFERIIRLYMYDRKMRCLISDAVEQIEIASKATMSNAASLAFGPNWVCEPSNFDYGFHDEIMQVVQDAISKNGETHKHIFLKHFFSKYSSPHPPAWMIMETLSFGGFSKVYKRAKGALRIPLASKFAVQHDILESWFHSLVFVRNVCAHHGRLWNRAFTIRPKIPKIYRSTWPEASQDKLYLVCCIIQHLLVILDAESNWASRLQSLIHERPGIPLTAMGFPEDWGQQPFWKLHT
jgi:abortive infection bacteriophage resistance protein